MDREKVLNEGFCTIYKDDSRQGFGAFVNIKSQKKKFGTKCACIVPDNVIKLNEFLCSKGQSKKYTGEITILETGPIHAPKRFDIVKLLYYDTTLGICCFEVNVKKELKRYSQTFYRDGVTGTDHKSIFAFKRSAEELILKNFGQQKEDILPVEMLITENGKDGLEKDGKGSYPVFMKMRHDAAYFYQLIGFLALRKGIEYDLLLCTNLKKALSCEETSFEGQSLFDRFMEDRKKEHQQPNNDEKQDQGAQAEEKQPEKKTSAENGDEQGDDLPLAGEQAGPKEKGNIPQGEEGEEAYPHQDRAAHALEEQRKSQPNIRQIQTSGGGLENQPELENQNLRNSEQEHRIIQPPQECADQLQNRQDQPSGGLLENQQGCREIQSRRETVKEPQRQEDLEARHGQQQDRVVQGGDGGKHIDDRNVELSLPKQPDKQYPSVQEILAVKKCVRCGREADIPLSKVEHILLKFNDLNRLLNKGDCDKIYHCLFDDGALHTGIEDTEGLYQCLQARLQEELTVASFFEILYILKKKGVVNSIHDKFHPGEK